MPVRARFSAKSIYLSIEEISLKFAERKEHMKRYIALTLVIAMALTMSVGLSGCRESERVSYNVSQEADNFNVMRRLAVINTVSGEPVFELIGRFSITADEGESQLEVVVEVEDGKYKKHIIGLNQATTMYVVEDINGANVNKFKYEINYLPKAIQPFDVVTKE